MTDLSNRIAGLSGPRRALLEQALQRRSAEVAVPTAEPIAIVGMACRFPGGAVDPGTYWDLLRRGVDATTEVPPGRWGDVRDPATTRLIPRGGFLAEPVDEFDATFFGISAPEADAMDPQQRLLLEVTWAALEDAGQPPRGLVGSRTGVFVGIGIDDYKVRMRGRADEINAYTATGNLFCVAAGRVSHTFGLTGPSLAVDTGCSSSLVAVHLACQSLRARECDLATAGGVHLMLAPDNGLSLLQARALSPQGRCRTFDAGADGYARGEGCGVVVLRRLSDATAAGDRVLAVIRGSSVNHDGPSSGLTVPNGRSQQALVRAALSTAGVRAADIGYVEMHGTGTPLGDPIEVTALAAALDPEHRRDAPVALGAVKTNIAHLEAAAGIAGLMKVVLSLQHDEIPATLHQERPNPRIPWADLPVEVVASNRSWPRGERARVAGISSFGIGGTNAHVIMADPPPDAGPGQPLPPAPNLLALSARSDLAVRDLAARYARRLHEDPDLSLADVARTAGRGRTHFARRLAVVAGSVDEAVDRLSEVAQGVGGVARGAARSGAPRVAFAFTGQGAQRLGMGRSLLDTEPAFSEAMADCAAALRNTMDAPLFDILYPRLGLQPTASVHDTTYTQPAVFALQYSLVQLWRSWGIEPVAVLGHSVGELAAATAVGVLTLEQGLALASTRGRLMGALPPGGAMVSVLASAADVASALAGHGDEVAVAAVNGPAEIVLSGREEAVAAVSARLETAGVTTRRLKVSHAFHSPLMDPVLTKFHAFAETLDYRPPRVPVLSTVTGRPAAGTDLISADYWQRGLRETVRFDEAVRALADLDVDAVVEMGPDPVLGGIVTRSGALAGGIPWLPSLRAGREDRRQVLESLGKLYESGAEVSWDDVCRDGRVVTLPTYPFERQRYWRVEGPERRQGRPVDDEQTLLGRRVHSPVVKGRLYESRVGAHSPTFLADHVLFDEVVVPGAAYLAMLAAADGGDAATVARSVSFPTALALRTSPEVTVQLITEEGAFRVVSTPDGTTGEPVWTTHARGILVADQPRVPERRPVDEIAGRLGVARPGRDLRAAMRSAGYLLGPSFSWITELHHDESGEVLARLERPAELAAWTTPHPGLIDSMFQAALCVLPEALDGDLGLHVPVLLDRFRYSGVPVGDVHFVHLTAHAECDGLVVDAALLTKDGESVVELDRVVLRRVPNTVLLGTIVDGSTAGRTRQPAQELLRHPVWRPVEPPGPVASAPGRWLVVADRGGVGAALAQRLQDGGSEVQLLMPDRSADGDVVRALRGGSRTGVVAFADDGSEMVQALGATTATGLALVQAAIGRSARLVLVTRGTQHAGGTAVDAVGQAAIWGIGRVTRAEHPELETLLVDLQPGSCRPEEESAVLARMLLSGSAPAAEVAIRDGVLHTWALEATPVTAGFIADPDASYLVTGGLGALGLHAARELARRGARHLVLVSRRPAAPDAQAPLAQLADHGTKVTVIAADIAQRGEIVRLVDQLRREFPPLRGVVHAAGVRDDGTLLRQTVERAAAVAAAKAVGAWHLHAELSSTPLDFFVLFSSAAGLLGTAGQGAYAAANATLDALAHHRHGLGLPATSIAWGPWEDTGMAAGLTTADVGRLLERGVAPLRAAEGRSAFGHSLSVALPLVAAFRAPDDTGGRAGGGVGPSAGRSGRRVRMRPPGLPLPVPPVTEAQRAMVTIWEAAFDVAPIGISDDFFELGGDSILSLQILQQARQAGLHVEAADLFRQPTIAELLEGTTGPAQQREAPSREAASADPDDVRRLLDRLATPAEQQGGHS